jgi:hypothetical protein
MLQKLIYSIFVSLSSEFSNFYVFLLLELFLDEPAMVLRVAITTVFRVLDSGNGIRDSGLI